jgi:hypothetical protein
MTETRNWFWLFIRAAWIAVGLLQGPWLLNAFDANHIQEPSWSFPFELIGIISVGIVIVVGMQAAQQDPEKKWPRPS